MDINSLKALIEQLRCRLNTAEDKLSNIHAMNGYQWFQDNLLSALPVKVKRAFNLTSDIAEKLPEVEEKLNQADHIINNLPLFGKNKELQRAHEILQQHSISYSEGIDLFNTPDIISLILTDCEKLDSFFQSIEQSFALYGEIVEKYRKKLLQIQEKFASINIQSDPIINDFEQTITRLEREIIENPLNIRQDIENILAQNEQKALAKFIDIKNELESRKIKYREAIARLQSINDMITSYQELIIEFREISGSAFPDEISILISNVDQEVALARSSLNSNQLLQFDVHFQRIEQYRCLISKKIRDTSSNLQQEIISLKNLHKRWTSLQKTLEDAIKKGEMKPLKSLQSFSNRIEILFTNKPIPDIEIIDLMNAFETRMKEELNRI